MISSPRIPGHLTLYGTILEKTRGISGGKEKILKNFPAGGGREAGLSPQEGKTCPGPVKRPGPGTGLILGELPYSWQKRMRMVASSARVAVPAGSRRLPLLPESRPASTAQFTASAAQEETEA